jgi:meso-butanediol dehydrogenase/(S,S)-butanediol dehydrogenase/diacetyl reductase
MTARLERPDAATVVITGAGGGIGGATAAALAKRGVNLVLVDLDPAKLEATRSAIADSGADVRLVVADVTDEVQVQGYVEAAIERFGRVDGFFNNAAYEGVVHPLIGYPIEDYERVFSINVRGVFLGLRVMLDAMTQQGGGGSIVNVSSQAGLRGVPHLAVYSASKHAVIGLSLSASLEAAPHGVRVNAVCPGPTATPMLRKLEDTIRDQGGNPESFLDRIPVGRYGEPQEIAELVVWLLIDSPAYLTGAVIPIDGGMTAP